ncbi:hypothetical protein LMG29542_02177 [Paraburkholderia humisilvae]|uniref:Uncharacterized protein n=1 Tax=Paraburkholderia humisilvae TaxID=627669 RepID=A0A6J5DKT7_9BURK|nr:hypothetical protein LMG29542_02177 [Paraburkholderia humisilvae]
MSDMSETYDTCDASHPACVVPPTGGRRGGRRLQRGEDPRADGRGNPKLRNGTAKDPRKRRTGLGAPVTARCARRFRQGEPLNERIAILTCRHAGQMPEACRGATRGPRGGRWRP